MKLVEISLLLIALLHTAFGVFYFSDPLLALVHDGVVDAAHGDPARGHAIWFLYAGASWFLIASLARQLSARGLGFPAEFGWGLIVFATIGATVSPASGFWLLFVPGVAALRKPTPASA